MDPYVTYLLVGILGGVVGVLFPYYFKVIQDPMIKFDYVYAWSLFVSMLMAITVFIPKGVEFDLVTAVGVFFACLGVTVPTNKTIVEVKKSLK